MPVGDTLINLIVSGGVALGLARLLQQQYEARIRDLTVGYEARIADLKDRVAAQSVKIEALLKANDQLADAALVSANAVRAATPGRE